MKILSDSRQIPKTQDICANKKYNDLLYSYLQYISLRDTGLRYVRKEDINFTQIGAALGITRQTASTKFKNLLEMELIRETPTTYELVLLPNDFASLIPKTTLKLINDTLSNNAISAYVYFFNRYLANNECSYDFTMNQIKAFLGLSVKTRTNNEIVTNILYVLQQIGLLKYKIETAMASNGEIKTTYRIEEVSNQVC